MCEGAQTLEPPHLNATLSGIEFTNIVQISVLQILGFFDENGDVMDYASFTIACNSFRELLYTIPAEIVNIIINFSEEEISVLSSDRLQFSTLEELLVYILRKFQLFQGDEEQNRRYRTLLEKFSIICIYLLISFPNR